tara:strand:+ start:108 stop:611 length:504 start_codon:yes stop_codon:yes gene_type:complete
MKKGVVEKQVGARCPIGGLQKTLRAISRFVLIGAVLAGLSGCAMFKTSPTLKLNMNLSPMTNQGGTLTVIAVPMTKSMFIDTNYKEAMQYVGQKQTFFMSLTEKDYKEGERKVEVPIAARQTGVGIFAFFKSLKGSSQWKEYVANAYGQEYTFYLDQNSITRFSQED